MPYALILAAIGIALVLAEAPPTASVTIKVKPETVIPRKSSGGFVPKKQDRWGASGWAVQRGYRL